jgi:hypothetical protein
MIHRATAQPRVIMSLICLSVLLWGCGGDSPSEPEAESYAGVWVGQTSANRAVRMVVSPSGAVDSLSITVRVSVGMGSCTGPLLLSAPASLQGSSLSATLEFPGSNITTTASGAFSGSSVSGSYQGYSGSFSLICGGSYIVGTGSPLSSGTWQATKQ